MRFGSFLLGGLVGAAAFMYFSRNKNSMMFSSFNSDNFGKVMNKAKGKMSGKSFAGNGLSEVKNIVENDPELHEQVQDILSESQGNSYTAQ